MNENIWGSRSWTGKLIVLAALLIGTLFCVWMGQHLRDYTGRSLYRFLNWDIFLAWVPVGFALLLDGVASIYRQRRMFWPMKIVTGLLIIVWLLFYPNSAYLVTDMIHPFVHYKPSGRFVHDLAFWYHLFLFITAAVVGLGLGTYSLSSLQLLVAERYGAVRSWVFAGIVLVLSSIGIYIGRFVRWNSWDVFTDPHKIVSDVMNIVNDPAELHFMLVFSGMILVISLVSYLIMRGGIFRLQQRGYRW